MSSATRYQPGAARATIGAATASSRSPIKDAGERIARLGLSPRQLELNKLWAYYRCAQHDAKVVDWNGDRIMDQLETEQIGLQGNLPPGFVDPGGGSLPLRFRRPSAPFHLGHLVVSRFTSLLFSEKRHPQYRIAGDDKTTEWLTAWAKAARVWPQMIQARNYGGATGTAVVTFGFHGGKPKLEVHDPRWCHPEWRHRQEHLLLSLDIRYMYPIERRDPELGWVEEPYWYRRRIDEQSETLWKPIPVGDGEEPNWDNPELILRTVSHNFGFFPGRWIQNLPVQDAIDGDPDCHGAFDTFDQIDALTSQGIKALQYNGDPTPVISADLKPNQAGTPVTFGSGTSVMLPAGGTATYMEISGASITALDAKCDTLERRGLQVCECVLERPDGAGVKTATEVDRLWSSMLAKADVMREQYGGKGLIPLAEDVIRAVRMMAKPKLVAVPAGGGEVAKVIVVRLPLIPDDVNGVVTWRAPALPEQADDGGGGGTPDLTWPRYLEPSLQDVGAAVTAAAAAKQAQLVDAEHATGLITEYFDVEDPAAMLDKIEKVKGQAQAGMDGQMMADMNNRRPGGGFGGGGGGPPPGPGNNQG